jgi:hypothetical protein
MFGEKVVICICSGGKLMEDIKSSLVKAFVFGVIMTVILYFAGDVRLFLARISDGVITSPPIWVQLMLTFLIYSVVFFIVTFFGNKIVLWFRKRKKLSKSR